MHAQRLYVIPLPPLKFCTSLYMYGLNGKVYLKETSTNLPHTNTQAELRKFSQ